MHPTITPKSAPPSPPRDSLGKFMVGLGATLLSVCVLVFFLAFVVTGRDRDHIFVMSGTLAICGVALILGSRP